jgi:hypothetical protein
MDGVSESDMREDVPPVTVAFADPEIVPCVAVTRVDPAPKPVASPLGPMLTTPEGLLDQTTLLLRSLVLESL